MMKDELLLTDKEKAEMKGFDNVIDWYLACLNAEVNILADPALRTSSRIDKFVEMAKLYIEKIAKTASIVRADTQLEMADILYKLWNNPQNRTVFKKRSFVDVRYPFEIHNCITTILCQTLSENLQEALKGEMPK